jgi:RNA polymerase sigma-70 factor, ECF subfamily
VEFEQHRQLLFSLAYRMLGSVADAEDIVQEAWIRWQGAQRQDIDSPRSYLYAVVTRLCIDQLRSARVRREEYVGPWLPEPLLEDAQPDVVGGQYDGSLSTAFLLVLERLTEIERAVFLLREVFSFGYSDIAAITGRSEAACRQAVKRARDRLASGAPRFNASYEDAQRAAERFVAACRNGDLDQLLALVANDAVAWTDGGGRALAARNLIHGRDRIARFFVGVTAKWGTGVQFDIMPINGLPGVVIRKGNEVRTLTFSFGDGKIDQLFLVANPDKLKRLRQRLAQP